MMVYYRNYNSKCGRTIIILLGYLCLTAACSTNNTVCNVSSTQQEMFTLLHEWCDALLDRQIQQADTLLDGGILCPACALTVSYTHLRAHET